MFACLTGGTQLDFHSLATDHQSILTGKVNQDQTLDQGDSCRASQTQPGLFKTGVHVFLFVCLFQTCGFP